MADDELSMESEFSQFSQIKETFLAALALGPCLIIFDGLDEITATMGHSMIEVYHFTRTSYWFIRNALL